MKERIDISVPDNVLEANAEKSQRLAKTSRFEPADRVPVAMNTNQWTALAARGRTAADYIRSPQDNLREQILNRKWLFEEVRDDSPIPTAALNITPDMGCLRGTEFEFEVAWQPNQPPKTRHPLTAPEQIDALQVPDPAGGLNARRIEWYHAMREAAADLDVRLNGTPLDIRITIGQPGGPMPSAFALAGANLFLWAALEPERVHRLMHIVTESHLNGIAFFDEMTGITDRTAVALGTDSAEMMGPDMFREFVVPCHQRIYEVYPGPPRGFHNCGPSAHLLPILRDELNVTHHNGFGFCVDPEVLAREMGGRVVLRGGPNPSLIARGPRDAIVAECARYIRILGRHGGFVLALGGGSVPGTPTENYDAMVEASRRCGCVQQGQESS